MIGSLGFPELMFILVLALLIFGPRRLPEIGRTLGRALGEFRRSTNELKRSIETEISLDEGKPSPAVRQGRGPRREAGKAAGEERAESADDAAATAEELGEEGGTVPRVSGGPGAPTADAPQPRSAPSADGGSGADDEGGTSAREEPEPSRSAAGDAD